MKMLVKPIRNGQELYGLDPKQVEVLSIDCQDGAIFEEEPTWVIPITTPIDGYRLSPPYVNGKGDWDFYFRNPCPAPVGALFMIRNPNPEGYQWALLEMTVESNLDAEEVITIQAGGAMESEPMTEPAEPANPEEFASLQRWNPTAECSEAPRHTTIESPEYVPESGETRIAVPLSWIVYEELTEDRREIVLRPPVLSTIPGVVRQ